jgi:hypothetical protein
VTTIHIFTAEHQPATRYFVDVSPDVEPFTVRNKPRSLIVASCCAQRRWAKHLTVQVFYDESDFYCRQGKGCKA